MRVLNFKDFPFFVVRLFPVVYDKAQYAARVISYNKFIDLQTNSAISQIIALPLISTLKQQQQHIVSSAILFIHIVYIYLYSHLLFLFHSLVISHTARFKHI